MKKNVLSLEDDVIEAEYNYYLELKKFCKYTNICKNNYAVYINACIIIFLQMGLDVANIRHLRCENLEFVVYNNDEIFYANKELEKAIIKNHNIK